MGTAAKFCFSAITLKIGNNYYHTLSLLNIISRELSHRQKLFYACGKKAESIEMRTKTIKNPFFASVPKVHFLPVRHASMAFKGSSTKA
jgi:hypothetical protein